MTRPYVLFKKGPKGQSLSVPVVTSDAVITSVAQVGVLAVYTPSTVLGTVTSRSHQWRIDGVSVSVGSYTPVTGDVGKTLTLFETVTNAAGNDTSTSAGKVVIAAPVAAVTNGLTGGGIQLTGAGDDLVYP